VQVLISVKPIINTLDDSVSCEIAVACPVPNCGGEVEFSGFRYSRKGSEDRWNTPDHSYCPECGVMCAVSRQTLITVARIARRYARKRPRYGYDFRLGSFILEAREFFQLP